MVEPQNNSHWKWSLEDTYSKHLLNAGPTRSETAESCGQLSSEHLHGWDSTTYPRQPVSAFDHSPGRSYFPGVWDGVSMLQLLVIDSCSSTTHLQKESGSVFPNTSHKTVIDSNKLPALHSPLRMKEKHSLHLYLYTMCSAPLIFMVLHWICLTLSTPPSHWGDQNGTESSSVK